MRNYLARIARLLDWRIAAPTLIVVGAVIGGWAAEDHRSCERTQISRASFNAYVDAAAGARLQSALHEARHDPVQAAIDVRAARRFLATTSMAPDCSTIPAGK